jgi:hypothetical protein
MFLSSIFLSAFVTQILQVLPALTACVAAAFDIRRNVVMFLGQLLERCWIKQRVVVLLAKPFEFSEQPLLKFSPVVWRFGRRSASHGRIVSWWCRLSQVGEGGEQPFMSKTGSALD